MQLVTLEFRFIVQTKAVLGKFLGLCSGAKRFGFRLCVLHHATATAVTCSHCAHATQFNCCYIPRDGLPNVMNVSLLGACGSLQFNAGSAPSVPSFLCKTLNRNVSRQQKPRTQSRRHVLRALSKVFSLDTRRGIVRARVANISDFIRKSMTGAALVMGACATVWRQGAVQPHMCC